jgi:hypothetical protein
MVLEDFHQITPDNILFVDDNIFESLDDEHSHRNYMILVFVHHQHRIYNHIKIEYYLDQFVFDLMEQHEINTHDTV